MSQTPPQSSLEYQPKPAPPDVRRQTVRLLVIAAAISLVGAINFFGCDIFLTIEAPFPGHPVHLEWDYTLFSLQAWRDAPTGCAVGLATGLASVAIFLLLARGISRGKRWPAIAGLCLTIPISALALLAIGSLTWLVFADIFEGSHFDAIRIQMQGVLLALLLATILPLTTIKLWKIRKTPRA
jgi:hypothetical protein